MDGLDWSGLLAGRGGCSTAPPTRHTHSAPPPDGWRRRAALQRVRHQRWHAVLRVDAIRHAQRGCSTSCSSEEGCGSGCRAQRVRIGGNHEPVAPADCRRRRHLCHLSRCAASVSPVNLPPAAEDDPTHTSLGFAAKWVEICGASTTRRVRGGCCALETKGRAVGMALRGGRRRDRVGCRPLLWYSPAALSRVCGIVAVIAAREGPHCTAWQPPAQHSC